MENKKNILKEASVLMIFALLISTSMIVASPLKDVKKEASTFTILFEDFEGPWGPYGNNPPAGWTIIDYGSETPPVWNYNDWHKYYDSSIASNVARVTYMTPYEDMDEWLITPSIDCSACYFVTLKFWQYFYTYYPNPSIGDIDVSVNGGVTWTTIISYTVPASGVYNYDISSLAAGQSNVKIRFRYTASTSDHGNWNIDDVEISCGGAEKPDLIIFDKSAGLLNPPTWITNNVYESVPPWTSVTQIGKWWIRVPSISFWYICAIKLENDGTAALTGHTIQTTLLSGPAASPPTRIYKLYYLNSAITVSTIGVPGSTTTAAPVSVGGFRWLYLLVKIPFWQIPLLQIGINVVSSSGNQDSVIFDP